MAVSLHHPLMPPALLGGACRPTLPTRGRQHLCSPSTGLQRAQQHVNTRGTSVRVTGQSGIDLLDAPSLFGDLDQQMAQMQRSFRVMEQQMNDEMGKVMQRSRQLRDRGEVQSWTKGEDGSQTFRNEQGFEELLPGGFRRAYRSESITYFGAAPAHAPTPQQALLGLGSAGLFMLAALLGIYASVAAAFWRNYHRTRYSWGKSWLVIALWPVLALLSGTFRRELRVALMRRGEPGSRDPGDGSAVQ